MKALSVHSRLVSDETLTQLQSYYETTTPATFWKVPGKSSGFLLERQRGVKAGGMCVHQCFCMNMQQIVGV